MLRSCLCRLLQQLGAEICKVVPVSANVVGIPATSLLLQLLLLLLLAAKGLLLLLLLLPIRLTVLVELRRLRHVLWLQVLRLLLRCLCVAVHPLRSSRNKSNGNSSEQHSSGIDDGLLRHLPALQASMLQCCRMDVPAALALPWLPHSPACPCRNLRQDRAS